MSKKKRKFGEVHLKKESSQEEESALVVEKN